VTKQGSGDWDGVAGGVDMKVAYPNAGSWLCSVGLRREELANMAILGKASYKWELVIALFYEQLHECWL
jgi:hypothetical protein